MFIIQHYSNGNSGNGPLIIDDDSVSKFVYVCEYSCVLSHSLLEHGNDFLKAIKSTG